MGETERLCPHALHPSTASHKSQHHWWVSRGHHSLVAMFCFPHSSCMHRLEFFCEEVLPLRPLICPPTTVWTHNVCFILWDMIQHDHYLFFARNIPVFTVRNSFRPASLTLTHPSLLPPSLCSGIQVAPGSSAFPCPALGSGIPQGALSLDPLSGGGRPETPCHCDTPRASPPSPSSESIHEPE